MKTKFLISLFILITTFAVVLGQAKPVGIYETYQEFVDGKPSNPIELEVIQNEQPFKGLPVPRIGGDSIQQRYYQINLSKLTLDPKETIFGYSDGERFYVPTEKKISDKTFFTEYEILGEYGYWSQYEMRQVGHPNPFNVLVPIRYYISKDGTKSRLTKKSLKKLIKDDKELARAFKKEKNRNKKLHTYLHQYVLSGH